MQLVLHDEVEDLASVVPPPVQPEGDKGGVGLDEILLDGSRWPAALGTDGQHLGGGAGTQCVDQHHVGVVLATAEQPLEGVLAAVPAKLGK